MKGILKKLEKGWLVKYTECCIDKSNECVGAKAICQPETIILPLHPDSWIWLEEYPTSKYVAQMMNDDNETEVEFELFEVPIFGSSGLVEDVDNVVFAKLKTV
jgi:hypothetical protein